MQRRTDSFKAKGNDGNEYVVHVYTDFHRIPAVGNEPATELPGQKELRTSSGADVTVLKKGEYEIVQTGVILRTDDPNAPEP